ncbi:helix-turn-helix domain-containing protein [Streptomyces sp. NPDC059466]|uniref:helix-turn-helix transcriptional regulator n=1 Tax=unclassified Streptomyces TaxID=2593676 RepID=UPI003676FEE3
MDKNGHADVTEVPYRTSAGAPPGVEVLGFADLTARARGHGVDPYSPVRVAFHELITVRTGTLSCSLDFTDHELSEGDWLWARPGQIHQFRSDLAAAEGTVVLFQPGFLDTTTAEVARVDQYFPYRPLTPSGAAGKALRSTLDLLDSEYHGLGGLPLEARVEVLRHLLAALVLHLSHQQASSGDTADGRRGTEAFRRFQRAVERDFARSHRVDDYAGDLGYSVRTLTRATRDAAGCGAKRFIDDRVLLEAKRLLVHTDLSAGVIAERIGFPEATVFTKFFRKLAGETPTAFRNSSRIHGNSSRTHGRGRDPRVTGG